MRKGAISAEEIEDVADYVEYKCNKMNRAVSVEEIQDMVENQLMAKGAFELARRYVRYRYTRSLIRKANTTDNKILTLIECSNEEVKQEIPTRTLQSTAFSVTIWQARSAVTLQRDCYSLRIL